MRLRKNLRIWMAVLLCMCMLFLSGFTISKYNILWETQPPKGNSPEPPIAEAPTQTPTEAPTKAAPDPKDREANSGPVDDSVFANTAIIGNSCILGLKTYGLVKTADFYAKVGMSVQNVSSYIDPASNLPLVEAVTAKPYKRILLMFGENELGWPYPENFIKLYRSLIERIRAGLPDAAFYIVGITPLGRGQSEKGTNGATMEHAVQFNQLLRQMAEEVGATFLDAWPVLLDKQTNYLKAEASSDGVHLNYTYCKIWANDMVALIEGNER